MKSIIQSKICLIVAKRRKRGKGQIKFPEMVAECFWKLKESIKLQIQEAQWPLIRKRKGSPKYIVVKMLKVKDKKEKTLRASREKWLTIYRELLWNYKLTSEINGGQTTLERLIQSAERIKEKTANQEYCVQHKFSSFTDKQKLREFITTRNFLQKMLKQVLY